MSKEERKEFSKLRKQQEDDMKGDLKTASTSGGRREQMLVRPGRTTSDKKGKLKRSKRTIVEHPSGRLKSKGRLEEDEMRDFEPGEKMEERLRPTPPYTVDQAADVMGLSEGYGKNQMKEIMDHIKDGTLTKKSKGGKVGSPRGVGKALRGWGKVTR